jgi:hypothetical protein
MRLQGLMVPGIYGPSKEEWTKYGMEPHEWFSKFLLILETVFV